MRWAFVGITATLLLLSLMTFFPSLSYWQPLARLRAAVRRTRVAREQDVKVWIVTRSGFYYCRDSKAYGKLGAGTYMRQGEALQRGYQPFLQKVCR
jgi:hypothetical protein